MKKTVCLLIAAVMLLSSCGAKPAATVGGMKITKGEFEWYLSSIKSQMNGTELQTEEDWETREIEGKKAIDVAKERALDIAVQNVLYIEAAEKAKIELSEEEKSGIKTTKNRIVMSYGGEKAYKRYLKENNISDKFIEMMCKSTAYYNKLKNKMSAENPITEEDKRQYFEENRHNLESEFRKAKHILIMTADGETRQPLSEEKQENARKLAEEILAKVNAGDDFDKLMRQYSEDPGLESAPGGYVFGTGEMVAEFEQATDSVGFGEIAFCKSDYGYHIIKRLPLEYEDVADKLAEKILAERVEKQIADWQEEFSVEIVRNDEVIGDIK